MKRIIVNADDFGINEIVTAEIKRMIMMGAVSSTTVMANGSCLDEVKQFANHHPEISYGVHLCLSEFNSITKNEGLHRAGLTDENGCFIRRAIFGLHNLNNKNVQNAIKEELNAQIDIVSSLGFGISHADSHHHIHTIYQLHYIIEDVLKSRGIKKLRLGVGFQTLRSRARIIKYLQFLKLNNFYRKNFVTTNVFTNYYGYCNGAENGREGQTIELMCHPGHPAERYRKEMALVERKIALTSKIELISYNQLTSDY